MRYIITHKSCDLDAIAGVWILKRFMPGWEDAEIKFVNAGEKLSGQYEKEGEEIEIIDGIEAIHVDTGMGALDHHQTPDNNICGTSRAFDFVLTDEQCSLHKHDNQKEAVRRIVELVVDDDHFQEVYYPDANADVYEAGIVAIIQGHKILHKGDDKALLEFGFELLDDIVHNLEAKIWAENEIKEKGIEFESKWGKAIAVETINDEILKRGQMMGYIVTVRRDPSYGYIRIKALPDKRGEGSLNIDLTEAYEKLKGMDNEATWFLHASKRMLLNGSSKNPTMRGTTLTLEQVVEILKA